MIAKKRNKECPKCQGLKGKFNSRRIWRDCEKCKGSGTVKSL